jgi:hypothetical protein
MCSSIGHTSEILWKLSWECEMGGGDAEPADTATLHIIYQPMGTAS